MIKKIIYLFLIIQLVKALFLLAKAIYIISWYLAELGLGGSWMYKVLYLGIIRQSDKLLTLCDKI